MATVSSLDSQAVSALTACVEILRGLAEYELDPDVAIYIRDLGERKEFLNEEEHKGLLAFVALTQERTLDKLKAKVALTKLRDAIPELFNGS